MIEKIKRILQIFKLEKAPEPKTWISSGGSKKTFFNERARNKEQLIKYRTIYEQGGIISEAIDSYGMFCFANGWRLEGDDEKLITKTWEQLETFDLDYIMEQGLRDTLIFGDGFQENIFKGNTLISVVPREAYTFEIIYDGYGIIEGYRQNMGEFGEQSTDLSKDQITHVQIKNVSGDVYGLSLIGKAYDEIMRDTKTAEASAIAIERHGFKKYHVKVGREGETIPQTVIENVSKLFQTLETKNEFTTPKDVEIKNIDEGGLEKIDTYNDISIMRLCAALGVPEEILGLRRGSTDATASTRIQTFFKKISRIQKRLERIYTSSVINKIVGESGKVRIVFNDISPVDEQAKAKWIAEIIKATPMDPFAILPRTWIQEQFNIEIQEEEDEIEQGNPIQPNSDQDLTK